MWDEHVWVVWCQHQEYTALQNVAAFTDESEARAFIETQPKTWWKSIRDNKWRPGEPDRDAGDWPKETIRLKYYASPHPWNPPRALWPAEDMYPDVPSLHVVRLVQPGQAPLVTRFLGRDLDRSSGHELDELAALVGVRRQERESDERVRRRAHATEAARWGRPCRNCHQRHADPRRCGATQWGPVDER